MVRQVNRVYAREGKVGVKRALPMSYKDLER